MKFLKYLIIASILLSAFGFTENLKTGFYHERSNTIERKEESSNKIQILNVGTFHFGHTADSYKSNFNERKNENQKQVHEIAKKLSRFKPTVILVEWVPEHNDKTLQLYQEYLRNPETSFKNPTEIELLAFEVGRLSGAERIYGIDYRMSPNYNIGKQIVNTVDSTWYNKYINNPFELYQDIDVSVLESRESLVSRLIKLNQDKFLDFCMSVNADMLTHAGTTNGFEGADEAAKYYQRNLRMYSNLNRLKLNEDDRVFILMGSSHTAFFRNFINRSPKYEMVDTFEYLN